MFNNRTIQILKSTNLIVNYVVNEKKVIFTLKDFKAVQKILEDLTKVKK